MLFLPLSSAQDTGEYVVSTTQDLSGDSQPDLLTAAPDGGTVLSVPGEVIIESGADGSLVVIIKGTKANDLFGFSVWSRTDFNNDGHLDLLIGAPNDYSGRVYLFYGPFLESGPLIISASNADAFFGTSDPEVTAFGTQVGAVGDLNCDGNPDFRVGGDIVPAFGPPTSRTYIISGATGEFLYQIEEATPFDPWEVLDGDIDGDGLVTVTDFNLVITKQGLTGAPGTLTSYDGDFNGDGVVDGTDLTLTITNLGLVGYQAILPEDPLDGCNNPCNAIIPEGYHCVQDCFGNWVILPLNVTPDCGGPAGPICNVPNCLITNPDPSFTTFFGQVGDIITIDPLSNPSDLLIDWTIQNSLPANATFLTGDPVNPTATSIYNSHTVQVLLLASGAPIVVHAVASECVFCTADFIISFGSPADQDGDGISNACEGLMGTDPNAYSDSPDPNLDTDNDGLTDVDEVCTYGTDPFYYDTDGDGLPDGWEIEYGSNPLGNDENNNGIFDDDDDFDGDGLTNHDEFVYGSDPFNPDTDGDGVNDGDEVCQHSRPDDASDGGIPPDPMNLAAITITVGDPSGSHSEHWMLKVGPISHKAPGYGMVSSATYIFECGETYDISLVHLGFLNPDCDGPDYDYTASVAGGLVIDPQNLLQNINIPGCPNENSAVGKTATLDLTGPDCGGGGLGQPGGPDDPYECKECNVLVNGDAGDDGIVCVGDVLCFSGNDPEPTCSVAYHVSDGGGGGGSGGTEGAGYCVVDNVAAAFCPQTPLPFNDQNSCLLLTSPGTITVTLTPNDDCDCNHAWKRVYSVVEADLGIDSNNNISIDITDELIEENSPGKVIFTAIGDSDDDGIPDYADGIARWTNPDGADLLYTDSGGQLVPLNLTVGGVQEVVDNGGSATITLTYSESNPANLPATPPSTWRGVTRPSGQLRIWAKDGSSSRDWHEIDASGTPGDFVASGKAYPLDKFTLTGGQINLFVEAINPSASPGDLTIAVSVDVGTALPCLTDTVTLTAAEIEVHDLRHWGPTWDSATGVPRIQNPDLDATNPDSQVGGAITDGTSICLLRLAPTGLDWPGLSSSTLTIQKRSDTGLTDTRVIGNLEPATTPNLPDLPNTITAGDTPQQPFSTGKLFYIPPDNYIDLPIGIEGPELNAWETCPMEFVLNGAGSTTLARIPFILRRPPVVLVHGVKSGPATWDTALWNEGAGSKFQTRMYTVNWSIPVNGEYNGLKGYENYYFVARMIEDALIDYRTANDGTHDIYRDFDSVRYAATRADVVGHSQGGQLTRFYIADGMGTGQGARINRTHWGVEAINNHRLETYDNGQWPYLRSSNYGAGSIRRFISMGSPFKGSPWANFIEPWFAPGDVPLQFGDPHLELLLWYEAANGIAMPEMLQSILFTAPSPDGGYIAPTCIADLCGPYNEGFIRPFGSEAMQALEAATYPSGHKRVLWFPIVGIATDDPNAGPVTAVLFEILFGAIFQLPGGNGLMDWDDLNLSNSDIIVPQCSQRNKYTGCQNSPPSPGEEFIFTAHSAMPPAWPIGETNSVPIRNRVVELLYGWPSEFKPAWGLGP